MSDPSRPTLPELARQALSSVQHGYDLLAPKFDHTSYRTPEAVLDAAAEVLAPQGPFGDGLDLCCGTGAGTRVLRRVCGGRTVGADFSAGMLAEARFRWATDPDPAPHWVRGEAHALPFRPSTFDLVVSFGAFGHFLPAQRPHLFGQVREVLHEGGTFAFPLAAPPRPGTAAYFSLLGFDAAMRVRNAVWRPPFVMYYRTWPLAAVRRDLAEAGFDVALRALPALGRREDGSPRCRLLVATKRPATAGTAPKKGTP
ncbi:methyltransferase domain-containing protein [Streptomyces tubbatahanensis]|uniref:Methyltransferase domain-containing protein n=1 Tax=Streptomyces tubbatahanensis TaxID=2923272 RepID=A0ABY3XQ16_9ACTN|nr:class I SAM-dependent methyltransferase [Streptomyces tubbatahanensis]UNS96511.1 methyltransferase domain-containing protein [Streptomyces tubbatahanensis]